jgi:hypothetical protein
LNKAGMDIRSNPYTWFRNWRGITPIDGRRHTNKAIFTLSSIAFGEREPEPILEDVRWGITSEWAARELYHVVFDPDTLEIDHAATDAAREAVRRRRLERGRPLAEFEAEWNERRPDPWVTRYFGAWPNPAEAELPAPAML